MSLATGYLIGMAMVLATAIGLTAFAVYQHRRVQRPRKDDSCSNILKF
jgi:hypothetical protein